MGCEVCERLSKFSTSSRRCGRCRNAQTQHDIRVKIGSIYEGIINEAVTETLREKVMHEVWGYISTLVARGDIREQFRLTVELGYDSSLIPDPGVLVTAPVLTTHRALAAIAVNLTLCYQLPKQPEWYVIRAGDPEFVTEDVTSQVFDAQGNRIA